MLYDFGRVEQRLCQNRLFLQNHSSFTLSTLSNMLWFYQNDPILNATFSAFTKPTDTFNKNEQCYMTLEGLSSVCAKINWFYKIILHLHYQPCRMLWFYQNDPFLNATFSAFTKTTDTFNKNKQCHMTLEG